MPSQDDAARDRDNRQDEMNSAALSRTFAALEPQTPLAQLYERLATVGDKACPVLGAAPPCGWGVRTATTAELAGPRAHLVGQALWSAVGLADHRHVRVRGPSQV
jgi:hypothetical protein